MARQVTSGSRPAAVYLALFFTILSAMTAFHTMAAANPQSSTFASRDERDELVSDFLVLVPIALARASWPVLPEVTAVPSVATTPSATPIGASATPVASTPPQPSPSATPPATAEPPVGEHGAVVLQAVEAGGLPSPPYFQMSIERAPWFTLYADGTYIRADQLDHFHWRTGRLSDTEFTTLIEAWVDRLGFFDYPRDYFNHGRCSTDGSTTTLFMRHDGREHRVNSYLLLWSGMHPESCPAPSGPEQTRFEKLAAAVVDLDQPLAAGETPYRVAEATVFVDGLTPPYRGAPTFAWPLERPISGSAGRGVLTPDELNAVLDVVRTSAADSFRRAATYENLSPSEQAWIGIRVEVPGWSDYCSDDFGWGCPAP